MRAKINSRGQIIIPKDLREKYEWSSSMSATAYVLLKKAGKLTDLKGILPAMRLYPGTAEIRREVGEKMGVRLQSEGD